MKRKAIIIIGIFVFIFVLLPLATIKVVTSFILTPEYLTDKITGIVNEETNISFKCKSIELEYFSTWPKISLSVNNCEMSFPSLYPDSIKEKPLQLSFVKLYSSLNITELIKNKRLCLEDLKIESPNMQYLRDIKIGKILKDYGTETNIKTNINEIQITNGCVTITDSIQTESLHLKNINLSLKGELASEEPNFEIIFNCDSLNSNINNLQKANFKINLKSKCFAYNKFQKLTFKDSHLFINDFPLDFHGEISEISSKKSPHINITFNLPSSNIKEILEYMPDNISRYYKDYTIKGNTSLNGHIKGKVTKNGIPDININGNIENVSIFKKGINQGIDKLDLQMLVSYINNNPDSCFIDIKKASITGFDSKVSINGQITNLQEKPFVYADIKGIINADKISKDFISADITLLKGRINSDMSIAFNTDELINKRWDKIWLTGSLVANQFEFSSPKYQIETYSSNTSLNFGYKKNKSDFISDEEVMNGLVDIDSVRITYKDNIYIKLSDLHARSNTTIPKHNEINPPITLHLNCKQIEARLDKDKWISASGVSLHAGSKVSQNDKSRNEGALVIDAATLKYIDNSKENAIILNKCNFIAEARPSSSKSESTLGLFKDWDLKGILNFESSKCYTHYFPQMTTINNIQLSFRNNQLSVNRAHIKTKKSDFMISGIIYSDKHKGNINKYEGTLQILANNINYNELKGIVSKGSITKENSSKTQFTLYNMEEEMKNTKDSGSKMNALYIPDNVTLNIQTNVENFNYNEVEMLRLAGDVIIKDCKAKIKLDTRTNLGKVQLNMLYDSKNTNNIKTYFDLKLNDILIGQIYQVIPEMGKTLPILKSIDGIASCHLTGETSLDKNSIEPDLKTAKAVCSISGNNLKLMDNKTFEEIAKRFRFKDKKHNYIDRIEANLILNKNEINVLPFMISWDRYEAILGGKQNLDFEYDYHIDIVKSPVPIDFGINIIGTGNNLEYKIKKCKYKKTFSKDGNNDNKTDLLREQITKNIFNPI